VVCPLREFDFRFVAMTGVLIPPTFYIKNA